MTKSTFDDLVTLFDEHASMADAVQQRIIEIDNKPERTKTFRKLPTREAAELLGISDSYLRRLVLDEPDLPKGESVGTARRVFAVDEVHRIREWLASRNEDARYRPARRGEEALRVVTVCNFKGGAAKTTTAVHLAQYLALHGWRVLLVDLDSQASATGMFGISADEEVGETETFYGYVRGDVDQLSACIRKTYLPGLDLLPANLALYRVEFELPVRQIKERTFRFWTLLRSGLESVQKDYDVVVCDCPPSLGYLTINALFASNGLIIPVPPSMLDFASTGRFFRMLGDTLADIRSFDPKSPPLLSFVRVLISRFQPNDKNQQRIAAWMTSTFADGLMDARMVHTTALDQAGNVKRTLYELDPREGRRVLDRALEHLNGVNAEIRTLIEKSWGREDVR
ncbi:MAG TPA: plasmid partitioning protein RepA [Geminicoccus sp.]|jgi:chromosome partitioning protein|uniref:plasmid partitioning protein RepA n=1 Tax=Geminicoccus sp. TaxID=2024832 RepID=UPI002E3671ED|nr:plasmid partitioning protein RepA [Geminicoccus sp.]HEX2524777.1 plasmid partitioning protein RepA [Geminicoccus sp.]